MSQPGQAHSASVSSLEPNSTPRHGSSVHALKKGSSDCLGRITPDDHIKAKAATPRKGGLMPIGTRITEVEPGSERTSNAVTEKAAEGVDWAVECLLLTHRPIRGDLAAIETAAKRIALDENPEEWRVRCFFRFFDQFCSLISQFFAVETHVHCDWLCAEGETGEQLTSGHIVAADYRIELMRQHQELEEVMSELALLEGALMGHEADVDVMGRKPAVSAATARTAEVTQLLREALDDLGEQLRHHLSLQEANLPEVMLARFGDSDAGAPAMLVHRIIEAARGALPPGTIEREQLPPLLTWVYHYLKERDAPRARRFAQHLPKTTRRRIGRLDSFLALDESHADRLRLLRAVEGVREPSKPGRMSAPMKRRPLTASEVAHRNSKNRAHQSPPSRRTGDDESIGLSAEHDSAQRVPALGLGPRRNSTEVRATNRKGALLSARLTAANANRDLTALPNDAMRDQIRVVAQQEAVLDWTPEAKWVDGLHMKADRAEQIAQEIQKRGRH